MSQSMSPPPLLVAPHDPAAFMEARKRRPAFGRGLMEYQDALRLCLASVTRHLPTQALPLEQSLGRVLREDQICERHVPPWDRAMMDGYAVKSADVRGASSQHPVILRQIDEVPAGRISAKRLEHGQTMRIMTGACVPEGADAVIRLENTRSQNGQVLFFDGVGENPYVVPKGQDLSPGLLAAPAGIVVTPATMGVLAACGIRRCRVSRKPRMAIISTGSELVRPGDPIAPGQIYDINSYALYGLCTAAGAKAVHGGIANDKAADLLHMLNWHANQDIILLSGGVSVGDYDIVQETLERAGVEEIFWRVKVQPGKPLFFGKHGKTLLFGLPGNPVSSFVNFHLFVRPVIDKMMGKRVWGSEIVLARATDSRIIKPGRRKFLRGRIIHNETSLDVEILAEQRSSVFSPMAGTDALIEVDGEVNLIRKGEVVRVHLLNMM